MIQPAFHIQQEGFSDADSEKAGLFLDFGQGYLCIAVMLAAARRFIALDFYQLKNTSRQEDLQALLLSHPLLNRRYNHVVIAFNTKESVLIPEDQYHEELKEQVLTMIHGDLNTGIVLSEQVSGWNIRNIYRVPAFYRDDMAHLFPGSKYWHIYSAILKMLEIRRHQMPDHYIYLVFYPNHIIVSVIKEKGLQLMQSFPYDIPEDVSYHLLNITDQFHLEAQDITIRVAGLIDTSSALYAELMKYFLLVEADARPEFFSYDAAFDEYPSHFFTPVFLLGLCV
jgi:hypothetical protein